MKTDRGADVNPITPDDDAALRALFARCEAPAMSDTLEARVLRAHADASSPANATPLAALFDEHRDDVWSFVLASVRDPDIARDALEDAFFRAQRRLDDGANDLSLADLLGCAGQATSAVWTFLRKTGHADHPLAEVEDDARALLLLRGGLGLSLEDLRRAGALVKDPRLDNALTAVDGAVEALVRALPLPAHEGAPAFARLVARAALSRGDELDLLSPAERARADDHVAACAPCALLRERARAAIDVPLRVCPGASEVLARVAERAEKDRAHRAAVDAVAARVSLACSYCHAPMLRGEAVFCAACLAPHHDDCFRDHGRCSAPGCGERAVVRAGGERAAPPSRVRRVLPWVALVLVGAVGGVAAWTENRSSLLANEQLRLRLDEESSEARELRDEKNQLQGQNLELLRRFDQEKRLLSQQLDELQRARSLEERDAILARARAEAADAAASDAETLDALWSQLQTLARDRQVKPEDLVAEARQSAEARLEKEIDAIFADIMRQAENREVEALIGSLTRLRTLMREAEAIPLVRARLPGWKARLDGLGEVGLSLQLQVFMSEGNEVLRVLADAVRRGAWDDAEAAFARAQQTVKEMLAQEREVFHRNAEALQLRADALIVRAGCLREGERVRAGITASGVDEQGPMCVINGKTYRAGDTVEGSAPPVRVAEIKPGSVLLRVVGETVLHPITEEPR